MTHAGRRPVASLAVALALFTPGAARATLIFDDGQTHTIDSAVNDSIQVYNGSTLNIAAGADIAAPGLPNIEAIMSGNATFNGSGGSVRGASGSSTLYGGGDALVATSGSVSISGGTYQGGDTNAPTLASAFLPGIGLDIENVRGMGPVSISGGTFIGGSGLFNPKLGADPELIGNALRLKVGSAATISGGTFIAGSGAGVAVTLVGVNGSLYTISGGQFQGRIAILDTENTGNAVTQFLGSDFSYISGILSGTLLDGSAIQVPLDIAGVRQIQVTANSITFSAITISVPEPPTAVMAGFAAVAGLAWAARGRSPAPRR
jgi:hypothetical protein